MSETITTADGVTLQRRTWRTRSTPKATVVIVHGLGEHSGRYDHVGSALADAGYETHSFDLRGHGESSGDRGHIESFEHLLDDVAAELGRHAPPRVLLGHSLGGLIATRYVLDRDPKPELLVLSSPALGTGVPKVKQVAARVLSRVAPKLRIPNGFDGSELSRDPEVGEKYLADPLVIQATSTKMGSESLAAIDAVRDRLGEITMPTLVIHGGDDPIVPAWASAPLADLPNVERRLFPTYRHECFNEDDGTAALETVIGWLDAQTA